MHTQTHTHTHTYIYMHTHTCTHILTFTCTHTNNENFGNVKKKSRKKPKQYLAIINDKKYVNQKISFKKDKENKNVLSLFYNSCYIL